MAWEKIYNIILNAIKAKTDNLPVDPASQSLIDAKLGQTSSEGISTIFGHLNGIYYHLHSPAKCYPSLADGITLTASNVSWQLGNFTEIIPINTINTKFDIHILNVEAVSKNGVYQVILYSGLPGSEIEISRVRFHKDTNNASVSNIPVQVPIQQPNARISAKIASKDGNSETMTVSVYYHTYTSN